MKETFLVHNFPVWREKTDFIISVKLINNMVNDSLINEQWEQIWAQKVEESTFRVCCIPFFVYGLRLNDIVETSPSGNRQYVISRVLKKSKYETFRFYVSDTGDMKSILEDFLEQGALVEFRSAEDNLAAVTSDNKEVIESITFQLKSFLTNNKIVGWENNDLKVGEFIG